MAVLAGGVWLLIGQAASYSRVVSALRRADAWWLVPAIAAVLTGYLGYALLYQAISHVAGGPRPPLRLTLRLTIAVFGSSVLATAAGRLGGEYWSLRRMRESPPHAWARVLALNTAAWAALAVLALSGSVVLLVGGGGNAPRSIELAWLLVPAVCAVPAVYLSRRPSLAEDRGRRIRRIAASVVRALVLLRLLARRRRTSARALAGAAIYWIGELIVMWAALRAFGVELGYGPLVLAYATGYASTMLPLPAGGAGGVDAATTYALTLVGVPLGHALLATLVQRVCTYWLPLAVAIVGARSIKRLNGDLAAVPKPTPAV